MAVKRATISLIRTAISLIVLGFVVEKFELFKYHCSGACRKGQRKSPAVCTHLLLQLPWNLHSRVGIILALFTYRYYIRWIEHLEHGELDTDKKIYFLLSLFVGVIGFLFLASMVML